MTDLTLRPLIRFPRWMSLWDEDEDWPVVANTPSGLSISEDDKHVFVEAAVPGIDPDKIEVTYDQNKGILWVKGEAEEKEEDKKKKYYRQASRSFSYRVSVPGEVDANAEPEASTKNGVMTVTFKKSPKVQPKKLKVKKA